MEDCSQYPQFSAARLACGLRNAASGIGIISTPTSRSNATQFWYVVIAIIIIAFAIDYNPVLGGWLLLLALASMVLINQQGYNIVSNPSDKKVSNL